MIKTAKQLKDLIRNISKKNSTDAQILMRNYMMERFLERISISQYKEKFILKGVETYFDGVRIPLKIDISTGDVITPKEVEYSFRLMFEDRSINVLAYNIETVLAEKMETVISRNITNTRMRDFYDIHILLEIYGASLNSKVLGEALKVTAHKRETERYVYEAIGIVEEVQHDVNMQKLWNSYQKKFSYALGISWETVMESIKKLYRMCTG